MLNTTNDLDYEKLCFKTYKTVMCLSTAHSLQKRLLNSTCPLPKCVEINVSVRDCLILSFEVKFSVPSFAGVSGDGRPAGLPAGSWSHFGDDQRWPNC